MSPSDVDVCITSPRSSYSPVPTHARTEGAQRTVIAHLAHMAVDNTKSEEGRTSSMKRNSVGRGSMSLEAAAAGVVDVDARATIYVVLACLIAAFGGLLFGYDAGITGGVEAMHQFAASYFPSTVNAPNTDFYCKYNDRTLAAYSAIMHFTGAVASLPASWFTQHWGRTRSMMIAGAAFIIGAIFQAATKNTLATLFIGRIFWGIGVGFGDHCAFIYTAEMAPPKWRGRLNTLVQCGTITGIVVGSAINIGANAVEWGWRIPLALAAFPGSVLLLGGIFLPETPSSLVERGHFERAKRNLQKVRGEEDVELEYNTIVVANEAVRSLENPWVSICRRKNRPQLALAVLNPFFQQWSGVNALSFFAPQIFGGISAFSGGVAGQLYAALLVNGVQMIATYVTVFIVDKVGRRSLLITGSTVGTAADIAVAILFSQTVAAGSPELAPGPSYAAIILIGIYSISFGFGWGPIGWLVPSEVHDLNTRSAGQSITVFTQLMSGAIVTQVFLEMMCSLKYGVFIFFGAFQFLALLYCIFLQPETRGVPIEEAANVVRAHWFWRRVAYPGGKIPATDPDKFEHEDTRNAAKDLEMRRVSMRSSISRVHPENSA